MRVILVAPIPPPAGGIASWTKRMLETELTGDWDIGVVDSKIIGNRDVFAKTKKNMFIEIKRIFKIWINLYKQLSDENVKIVHSCIPAAKNSMIREIVCMFIAKMRKKKFVIHYRCTIPNMINDTVSNKLFKYLTKKSDAIMVLNKESRQFIDNKLLDKVYLIPNFVESKSLLKGNKDIDSEVKTVFYAGGVTLEKGALEIIELAQKFPKIEFRLAGVISDDILSKELTSNVQLLGQQKKENIIKELINTDVFLFPSFFLGEGFSNSLVEAMAMGVPCIVSDWAANKDMIENKGGIVVPAKDVESLEEALKKIQYDCNTRKEMSIWNIEKVKLNYLDEIVIQQYVDVYDTLIRA